MYGRNNTFVGRGVKSVRNPAFRELQRKTAPVIDPARDAANKAASIAAAARLRASLIAKGLVLPTA